ncbi:MAG: ABC transporter ATP-binding protein [Bacteroidaceae bacterium]|nr:ABC transporter ATP-binding protein [Bacteroidaceae bacterium]
MKSSITIFRWFWGVFQTLRVQAVVNAVTGIVQVGLDFAFIYFTKLAIDIATGHNTHSLTFAASLLVGVIGGQIAIGFARRWIAALLGVRSQNRMQLQLFRRLLQSEWNGRDLRHSGDVLNRLEQDVQDVTSVVTETLPAALGVLVRFVGAFWMLYSMDPMLACLMVVIAPAFILVSRLYVRRMRKITRDVRDTDSCIQSILQESIQHRMVLKTLERTDTMVERLDHTQQRLRDQVRHRTLFSSFSATVVRMGFATGYLVTFLWGVNSLQNGLITYGMMTAFIQLVGQIQGPFRDMTRFVPIIISAFTAGERLMELEDIPQEIEGEPIRFAEGAGIRFTDVCYTYAGNKRQTLQQISYDFKPGSVTAILGETGVGKTTLMRLVLALLRPSQGSITIYGADGRREAAVSPLTRCNMVYVPQGNTLFSGTIRDNLLLGNPDATDEEMRTALQLACADFVFERPEALYALCGEMGQGMSEGQAQRIAIARALLRRGSILLLDEATSALDSATEQRLLANLSQHTSQQTVLFITHRPSVIDHATDVLRLER